MQRVTRTLAVATIAAVQAAVVPSRMEAASCRMQQPPGEPIDPGIEDRGPLSESLRIIQPGLEQPHQFEKIYRIIGPEGEMLMRGSGGLYAVFPRSEYVLTRKGPLAKVPPGTVFYIGALPSQYQPKRPLGPLPENLLTARRLDGRDGVPIDTQIDMETPGLPHERRPLGRRSVRAILPPAPGADDSPATTGTIATDEAYRARRVRELLAMAAAAERASDD